MKLDLVEERVCAVPITMKRGLPYIVQVDDDGYLTIVENGRVVKRTRRRAADFSTYHLRGNWIAREYDAGRGAREAATSALVRDAKRLARTKGFKKVLTDLTRRFGFAPAIEPRNGLPVAHFDLRRRKSFKPKERIDLAEAQQRALAFGALVVGTWFDDGIAIDTYVVPATTPAAVAFFLMESQFARFGAVLFDALHLLHEDTGHGVVVAEAGGLSLDLTLSRRPASTRHLAALLDVFDDEDPEWAPTPKQLRSMIAKRRLTLRFE